MEIRMAELHQTSVKSNGHLAPPLSRRAFQRSLPGRLGVLEQHLGDHEEQFDEFIARLRVLEARSRNTDLAARVDLVEGMLDLFRLVLGKRRSRRRLK
jgi:hypothetical protein